MAVISKQEAVVGAEGGYLFDVLSQAKVKLAIRTTYDHTYLTVILHTAILPCCTLPHQKTEKQSRIFNKKMPRRPYQAPRASEPT